jgi:hypothetical protein
MIMIPLHSILGRGLGSHGCVACRGICICYIAGRQTDHQMRSGIRDQMRLNGWSSSDHRNFQFPTLEVRLMIVKC